MVGATETYLYLHQVKFILNVYCGRAASGCFVVAADSCCGYLRLLSGRLWEVLSGGASAE